MSPRWLRNSAVCAALATLASTGCATTQYQPQLAARGELLLRYDGGFVMQAQGQTVARALSYRGLDRFVACVPEAHQHARSAQTHGGAAIALSVIGVTLSLASLGSLAGLADTQHQWSWLGGGLAAATAFGVLYYLDRRDLKRSTGQVALLPLLLEQGSGLSAITRF